MKKGRAKKKIDWNKLALTGAWVVGICAWVWAAFVGAQTVVARLAVWIFGVDTIRQPLGIGIVTLVAYLTAIGLIIMGPIWAKHIWRALSNKKPVKEVVTTREEMGLTGIPTWTDIGLGLAGMVVYLLLASVVIGLMGNLPGFDAHEVQEIGFSRHMIGGNLVIALITLAVVAPITEEVLFRGWMYGKMRSRMPSKWGMVVSMVVVSAVFGVLHGQWNVAVNVFVMSIVMCAIREMTGTIWGAIILHIIKNAVAAYAVFMLGM